MQSSHYMLTHFEPVWLHSIVCGFFSIGPEAPAASLIFGPVYWSNPMNTMDHAVSNVNKVNTVLNEKE